MAARCASRYGTQKICVFQHLMLIIWLICAFVDFSDIYNDCMDMDTVNNSVLDLDMGKNKKDKTGVSTPPIQPTHKSLSAQQPSPNVKVSSGNETSHYLSQANNVLYMQNQQNQHNLNQFPTAGYMTHVNSINLPSQGGQYAMDIPQFTELQSQQNQQLGYTTSSTNSANSERRSTTNIAQGGVQPWLSQILQKLDTRLSNIESQLQTQNSKWQHIDSTLQNQNVALQDQNTRMLNIEHQVTEINNLKQTVSHIQNDVQTINSEMKKTHETMNEYDRSIKAYSDKYDEILRDKDYSNLIIDELCERVRTLEYENDSLNQKQSKTEYSLVDLQCRSMRDNLIFTGIDEAQLGEGEGFEDVEQTLCRFLQTEMGIENQISFHRVHRLGAYKAQQLDARPIIAKFERFKDRELVRAAAPRTLKGKSYGVREQFPKIIEDRRKQLYPEMKRAKLNKENKVRLVRDKLYINQREFIPKRNNNENQTSAANQQNQSYGQRSKDTRYHQRGQRLDQQNRRTEYGSNNSPAGESFVGGRTFYRNRNRQRPSPNRPIQSTESMRNVDFTLPTANRFDVLTERPDQQSSDKTPDPRRTCVAGKHPASSPLDSDLTFKKHREDSETDISDIEIDTSPQSNPPAISNNNRSLADQNVSLILPDNSSCAVLSEGPTLSISVPDSARQGAPENQA